MSRRDLTKERWRRVRGVMSWFGPVWDWEVMGVADGEALVEVMVVISVLEV